MFQLKEYQQRCLDELTGYFRRRSVFLAVADNLKIAGSMESQSGLE
jgi:hypothetical protein